MNRFFGVTRLNSEWFIRALIAVVGAASLFPSYGAGARIGVGCRRSHRPCSFSRECAFSVSR